MDEARGKLHQLHQDKHSPALSAKQLSMFQGKNFQVGTIWCTFGRCFMSTTFEVVPYDNSSYSIPVRISLPLEGLYLMAVSWSAKSCMPHVWTTQARDACLRGAHFSALKFRGPELSMP